MKPAAAPTVRSGRSKVVGQIMPKSMQTVTEGTQVAELVPLMADAGLRHILIVDGQRRLSGIIAQSNLIAALYRSRIQASHPRNASRAV